MKISELIEQLGEIQGDLGDLEVFVYVDNSNGGGYAPIDKIGSCPKDQRYPERVDLMGSE